MSEHTTGATNEVRAEEVFRLKLSMGTANSGGGDWPMFNNREDFKIALLEALLEVEARGDLYRNHKRQAIRAWVLRKQPRSVEDGSLRNYGVRRVLAAEQFVNGQWVPLTWRLVAPRVEVERA